ncbi:dTDP-4-amino-4,6-dideoxygalactose transaminase [archaeon]|nr:dTDP-4-amino-4,6-dideoxygalactose transaminase [archaeon]
MIPFNKPYITGKEIEYIKEVIESRNLNGDKNYAEKCHKLFEQKYNIKKALLTPSCTDALELAGLVIGLSKDDEVLVPSYTFPSTADAIITRGAKPVFVEIEENTLNIDLEALEDKITDKTKAICPVHYAGISCDMDHLTKIAKKYDLYVIEDAAQGVHAKYKDRWLGTHGDLAAYSFHETKNVVCGEGGLLCVNNSNLIEKAEQMRDCGTNRPQFRRGEIPEYSWVREGFNCMVSDLVAAFLYAQMEKVEEITEKRTKIAKKYTEMLKPLEDSIKLMTIPEYATPNYHIYYFLVKDFTTRENMLKKLKENGIQATSHYRPLHSSKMGERLGYKKEDLPKTEELAKRIIRLPVHPYITEEETRHICEKIKSIL